MDHKQDKPVKKGSVFDNPYYKNAFNALSHEDKKKYRKMGEHMYGKINFQQNRILDNNPPPHEESLQYIETSFKSGLLPKDLSKDELDFMSSTFGKEWYTKYDFLPEDLE
jgi:hypothetical protein